MAVVRPESFARWSPQATRQQAEFIVRLGTERDVEACVRFVVAIGAGDGDAWWRTLTRTVRDGRRRALFVAEAHGEVVGYGRVVFLRPIRTRRRRRHLVGICWGSLSIRPGGGEGSARR